MIPWILDHMHSTKDYKISLSKDNENLIFLHFSVEHQWKTCFLSFIARKDHCFQIKQLPLVTKLTICRAKLPPEINLLKISSDWKVNVPGVSASKEPTCNVGNGSRSLDQEYPLVKEMATHSSILAWIYLWAEEPGGLQSMVSQELDTTENTPMAVALPLYSAVFS